MEHFRTNTAAFAAVVMPALAGLALAAQSPRQVSQFELPGVFTAMSYNVRVDTFIDGGNRWSNRKANVCDLIADHAPDVVGIQEAKNSQYLDIRRTLPRYEGYAVGRSNGKTSGETCAILYRGDRFVKTDSGTFWFSDTPEKPGSKNWGNMPPRICSWVHLTDRQTRNAFYVYNVHLDHLSQTSRAKSVRLLAQRIAERKTEDPFIVMGDFNMKMDNAAMQYLQTNTAAPMADAWTSLYPGKYNAATYHGFRGGSGKKIDHMPLSHDLKPLSVVIDNRKYNGRHPSDHSPLIATILLPERTFAEAPRAETRSAREIF